MQEIKAFNVFVCSMVMMCTYSMESDNSTNKRTEKEKLLFSSIMMRNTYYCSDSQKEYYLSEIKKLIREDEVNIDCVDSLGNTPLINAVSGGDIKVVKFLLKNKADVNKGNKKTHTTPLMSAVYAMVNLKEHGKSHPWLFKDGFEERIKNISLFLLSKNIDINKKNICKRSVIDLARMYNLDNFVSFLEQEGLENCPICLDAMDDSSLVVLNCTHKFHSACINKWKEKKENCPICKSI